MHATNIPEAPLIEVPSTHRSEVHAHADAHGATRRGSLFEGRDLLFRRSTRAARSCGAPPLDGDGILPSSVRPPDPVRLYVCSGMCGTLHTLSLREWAVLVYVLRLTSLQHYIRLSSMIEDQ